MAVILHTDRMEVFAFAETGLKAVLEETLGILADPKRSADINEKGATMAYERGTFYVVLPYKVEDD